MSATLMTIADAIDSKNVATVHSLPFQDAIVL